MVHNGYILSGMERLNLKIDEDTANLLAKQKNKSEFVRNAIMVHTGYIKPGEKTSLLEILVKQNKTNEELLKKIDELQWKIEETHELMTKIANRMGGDSW